MIYKCKRCGKTALTKRGLHCERCDLQDAQTAGVSVIYPTPPGYSDIAETKEAQESSSFFGGGGDYGGGGASSDY
jgi:uncharacterized membrane protein YgcG